MEILWQIIFYLVLLAIPVAIIYFFYKRALKKQMIAYYEAKQNTTLAILVPKENEKKPVAAEQMFASLHGIFRAENRWQDQVSFEIVARDKFIQFYINLPKYLKDFVEGQMYAQYPNVEIFEVKDYTQENFTSLNVASTCLDLTKEEVYPIKTFTSFEVDPLAAITGVLSKVAEGQQIWMQIIVKPVSDTWQIRGISHVTAIKAGQAPSYSFSKAISKGAMKLLGDLFRSFFAGGGEAGESAGSAEVKLSGPQEEALKETERKSTKLGFATKIRIVVLGRDQYAVRAKIEEVVGAFKQFSTTNLNAFKSRKIVSYNSMIDIFRRRKFYDEGYILNIEELASLYHLPTITVETPNIVWAGSKKGEPPSNLPVAGAVSDSDLTTFAETNFRNIEKTFGIKRGDRRLHMYIIGKTGTGKSTLLQNMIIDDIKKGQGVAYIDPHGQAIDYILDHIPAERINDVVYFNPADRDWPIGFNPLEAVDPDLKNIVASGVVGIFKKIFGESWGPRLEYILRNTVLAAIEYPNSTLLSVMRILTDKDFRRKVVTKIKDPVIKDFFLNEYEKYDPKFQREAIAPIQNKVGQFLASSTIRNIVGQPKSTIDLYEIMNSKKIFLVDLSVGKIGEDSSALLGSMIITKFQLAAMQRANIIESKRSDFYLYVDEFQNFATDSFAVILSEARKYRLNLIMTNQYIAQMPEVVAKAIFGNVGSILSFRVGATDASGLVKEFEPVFVANDMVNLSNYNIYVKMAIDGVTRPAFSALTLPPAAQANQNREKIIKGSRERYCKAREFVEEKIANWNEEAQKSRLDEEEAKKKKPYSPENLVIIKEPKSKAKVENLPTTQKGDYYIFVDNKGKKWYIPTGTKSEKLKVQSKKTEDPKPKTENRKLKTERPKFAPVIAPQLNREAERGELEKLNKIIEGKPETDRLEEIREIKDDNPTAPTKQTLVNPDELEKHLQKKKL